MALAGMRTIAGLLALLEVAAMPGAAGIFSSSKTASQRLTITESCYATEARDKSFVPGGKLCTDPTEQISKLRSFPLGENEDSDAAYSTSTFVSASGSTMTIRSVGEHKIGVFINDKETFRFKDPGGVADPIG